MSAAVELGIADAREYCRGLEPKSFALQASPAVSASARPTSVRFTETMTGRIFLKGGTSYTAHRVSLTLYANIDDLEVFIRDPRHEARADGKIRIGRKIFSCSGTLAILIDRRIGTTIEPGHKRFVYDLGYRNTSGAIDHFYGTKYCDSDSPKGVWHDTTTAYFYLASREDESERRLGAGILRISPLGFVRELLSLRARDAGPFGAVAALMRFFRFFVAQCFDTYCRNIIDYGPF